MKITFVLPNVNLRGGTRVVMDYAGLLGDLGAEVTVVFPTRLRRLPFPVNEIEYLWRAPHKLLFHRWFSNRVHILPVPSISPFYMPKSDVIVATAWQTAAAITGLSRKYGERYYFIQDIETYNDGERAAATYRLPFRRIVISPWVRAQLAARFGAETHALVPNGLDFDLYKPGSVPLPGDHLVVGALYDSARKKGFDVVLAAFEKLREANANAVLRVFGLQRRDPRLPAYVEPRWRLSPQETVSFYHSCHIWLCGSRSEGMHLPPMEAMACGCALATTRIGGTSYYAIPNRTALVCEPGDISGLAGALTRLSNEPGLRQQLIQEGAKYVRRLDVRESAKNLFRALSGNSVFIEPDHGVTEAHCD